MVLGSSPLTWGKLDDGQAKEARARLIPAHVGKTARSAVPTWGAGAHPRSRGENIFSSSLKVNVGGSSPLTWGKPLTRPRERL